MNSPETRDSLIARLQGQRNEPAWGEFVAAYEPFLRRLVQRQHVPERHVADVTQQVLAAIAVSVDRWQDDGQPASFRRWVSRVARNIVIKFMMRERRQVGGQGGSDLVVMLRQVPDDFDQQQQQRYEHELIVWAAEQVRERFQPATWQAFWCTCIEGRSIAEVAQELKVSPGSVYMSRSRIIARIQAKVAEVLDE